MQRLLIIDSGSKCNAALVEYDGAALLIDCGTTLRALLSGLDDFGLTEECIKAVFITHTHSDHIRGLSALHNRLNVGFYSGVGVDSCEYITEPVTVCGFVVTPFRCSHDVPCVGYRIDCGGKSIAIATDTGVVTPEAHAAFIGCETVMLESNHDAEMLRQGNYPAMLKARIAADTGHLSNADCAKQLAELSGMGLHRAVLAHLSENNNTRLVARATTENYLAHCGISGIEVVTADAGTEIII